jgi:hypothetical protein
MTTLPVIVWDTKRRRVLPIRCGFPALNNFLTPKHLEGNDDTKFKKKLFDLLEYAYTKGQDAGEIELFGDAADAMRFRIMLQDEAWQNELQSALV